MTKLLLIGLLVATVAMPLRASPMVEQCASSRTTSVAYLRCLESKYGALNEDLTLRRNSIGFKLAEAAQTSGRTDAVRIFQKSQSSFDTFRENNCKWQYLTLFPDNTAAAIRYKECQVEMTEQRVIQLKNSER